MSSIDDIINACSRIYQEHQDTSIEFLIIHTGVHINNCYTALKLNGKLPEFRKNIWKSVVQSKYFRKYGSEVYLKQDDLVAIIFYSRTIANAP